MSKQVLFYFVCSYATRSWRASVTMFWFDSHIHLSSYQNSDRQRVVDESLSKNIQGRIMAGYNSHDWDVQLQIQLPNTYRAFGLHPWQVLSMDPAQVEKEIQRLSEVLPEADLMGETGLDGFRAKTDEQMNFQEQVFHRHLEMNKSLRKPLALHIVKSHERAQKCLKPYSYGGFVHGFSGSWEVAQTYIDMGFMISVGRGVFHKGYKSLKEAVRKIPLSSLLIESDAESSEDPQAKDAAAIYSQVVQAVCELKNISQEQLQEATFRNINLVLSKRS